MLVERNQFAERLRRQSLGQNRGRRSITLERTVRHKPVRRTRGPDLFGRFTERERLGLREHIGQQEIMVLAERIERVNETDEVARDKLRPLMDELVEGVLAVGARLAPVDRPGLIVDPRAL